MNQREPGAAQPAVGWHGKLPTVGDFATRRLDGNFVSAWDDWLCAGLARLRADDPQHWLEAYLASPTWRFVVTGQRSLIIGIAFLSACLLVSHAIGGNEPGTFRAIGRESLTIAGWVAMWRPMQIYLYDWWPLRHRGKLYQKLARMHVSVQKKT